MSTLRDHGHVGLGPGGEFDIVRRMLARWGDLAVGIGDDAALLTPPADARLVISTDTSVENVHFRRDWLSHREIAYRATAAAISDLAAMAATPLAVFLAVTLTTDDVPFVEEIADGVGECVGAAAARIFGGDVTRGESMSLTLTVIGSVSKALRRDGAVAGDRVYLTGALGGPVTALRAFQAGRLPATPQRARFSHPLPRWREARWLAERGAHAAIDISDGVVADARHLASASNVIVRLRRESVPVFEGATISDALVSGEEYELLVTSPDALNVDEFVRTFGIALAEVGDVRPGDQPGVELVENDRQVAAPAGHDHFRVL